MTMTTKKLNKGVLIHLKEPQPRQTDNQVSEDSEPATGKKDALPDVAHVILGYVAMYPDGVHGYRLGRTLSEPPLRVPSLRLGHLYRVLRRLQRARLVACTVEAQSSRLRYRFSITPAGETAFRSWLVSVPRGSGLTRDHVLERLRFADRVTSRDVLRLIDEAVRACESELADVTQQASSGEEASDGVQPQVSARIYLMARKARLADDRCWLEEVRRLVERDAQAPGSDSEVANGSK
jgi:DNA-binding PadR family transcriptional regulator